MTASRLVLAALAVVGAASAAESLVAQAAAFDHAGRRVRRLDWSSERRLGSDGYF